jgi:hypothetical protein
MRKRVLIALSIAIGYVLLFLMSSLSNKTMLHVLLNRGMIWYVFIATFVLSFLFMSLKSSLRKLGNFINRWAGDFKLWKMVILTVGLLFGVFIFAIVVIIVPILAFTS